MNKITLLRVIGNALLIVGYCAILYMDLKIGLPIKFLGGILVIPSLIQFKMWDGVILTAFFAFVEATRLIQLYLS